MPSGIEAGRITGLEGKTGPRIAMRNWRISTRLVSLLALPVVTASALGGMRIHNSLDNIQQLEHMKTLTDITEHATDLAAALQEERDSSAGPLAAGQKGDLDAVTASRQDTDREMVFYKAATDNVSDQDPVYSGVRATLVAIGGQLAQLAEIRNEAYSHDTGISQTVSEYDGLVTSLLSLSQDMAQATNNPEMIKATRALAAFSSAKEYESIQRAVISAAFASGGKLSANDYQNVKWASSNESTALTRFEKVYGNGATDLLAPIEGGNITISDHESVRERIVGSPDAITKIHSSYLDWDDAAKAKTQAMNQIERSLLNEMQQKSLELQKEAKQDALISGAIILLVLGVAVVGAFVVARSMIRSLRRLQQTAQDVAQKRLPDLVKQLSETDPQDVDTSVVSIGINSRDEIGQVARAFDEVHSEAVRLAAEQALLRGNVNAMFTNLSRRSQGLIQRQLSLISELESREADPDQLSSLFKLDHLATRMRRNGENLLVLAGEEPGRRWTRPVPLVDVLRAAASEVEQYERIELTSVPASEVTGRIVNDLVHLLAELLENATSFSSPQTKVRVTGHSLPDGRVLIEIHDTGIGLSPEDLADINERLANPPTVDVSVSRRMGLFVVGRLSLRHGIRIQLRPSDSGGTTALVMLPVDVTQGGAGARNGGPGAGRPGAPGGGIANAFGNSPRQAAAAAAPPQRGQVGTPAQRPALDPGPGGPGGAPAGTPQPAGPRWAAAQEDTPRGHEEAESPFHGFDQLAPAAPRPDVPQPAPGARPQQPGPGRQGGFPPPQPQNTGPEGFRSDVFGGRPGPMPRQGGGAGDSGQFARPPQQGGPGDTSQFPAVREDDFAPGGQGGGRPAAGLPQRGPQGSPAWNTDAPQDDLRGPGDTSQLPAVRADGFPGGPGDTSQFPAVREDGFAGQGGRPGDTGSFQMPQRPGDTGSFHMPQQPGDTPPAFGGGTPGSFPTQRQAGGPAGPGDTSQFPAVRGDGFAGQGGRPGDTGSFQMPQQPGGASPAYGSGAPGSYPAPQRPGDTPPAFGGGTPSSFAMPQQPGDTGSFPVPPQGGRPGEHPQQGFSPYDTGAQPVLGRGGDPSPAYGSGATGSFPARPQERDPLTDPLPPRPQAPQGGANPSGEPMALPPAPTRGDEPTPIFSSIESDWFRTGQAERMQQVHVEQSARGQQAPLSRPVGRTAPPQRRPGSGPQRPGNGPQPAAQPASSGSGGPGMAQPLPRETPNWRTSPNDALRQRAEAVREPSAGGVTPAGLPRRVPRANLVAGGATQPQAPQGGPQVSRAPDAVRGRLTNLRRGIQQGRQAGGGHTDGRGFGMNNQER